MQGKIEVLMLVLVVVALLVVIGAGPLLTIFSLNTMFGLNIAYTIWTYLSVMWLNITTFGGLSMTIHSLKQK